VRDELLLYAVHGMLHLCGYDDRTDRDFAAMHRREDHILSRLGVGAIFGAGATAARGARVKRARAPLRVGRAKTTGNGVPLPMPPNREPRGRR
jgi:hypothetical protein